MKYKKIDSFKEFYDLLTKIGNHDLIRNSFIMPGQLASIIENENNKTYIGDDFAVILINEIILYRVLFFAKDKSVLSHVVELIKECTDLEVVCDIISEENEASIISMYENVGMKYYTTFIHMHCQDIAKCESITDTNIEYAKVHDANDIYDMISRTFDKWSAHFPNVNEIENAILKQEIYIIRENDKIISFAWYENRGKRNSILRYVIVLKNYRGRGLGQAMFKRKICDSPNITNYELWVEKTNHIGQHQHEKNGYIIDYKVDCIFKIN